MKFLNVLITLSLLWFAGCQESKPTSTNPEYDNPFVPTIKFATVDGTNAYVNANIVLNFKYDINQATLSNTAIILTDTNTTVATQLSANGKTLTINPNLDLKLNTVHTIRLTTELALIINGVSKSLDQNYTYSFTTSTHSDTTIPTVTARYPQNGDTNVSVHASMVYSFNKSLDQTRIPTVTMTGRAVNITVGRDTLLIKPTSMLDFNTSYTVSITGLYDSANNAITDTFTFTTQTGPALINTYNSEFLTSGFGIGKNSEFVVLRHDANVSAQNIYISSDGQIWDYNVTFDINATPTALTMDNGNIFIAYGNRIVDYSDANRTFDFNISYMDIKEERACLVSQESQTISLYGVYPLSNYEFHDPIKTTAGVNATNCLIDKGRVFAATTSGIYIYDVTNVSAVTNPTIVGTSASWVTVTPTKIVASSGSSVNIYDRSNLNTPSTLNLNTTLGQVAAFDRYVFASAQNGTQLFILAIDTPTPQIIYTIHTTQPISTFAVGEHELVIFHPENGGITESIYNLEGMFLVQQKDVLLANTPYTIKPFYDTHLIADGKGVLILPTPYQTERRFDTAGTAVSATGWFNQNTSKSYIAVADSDHGVPIFDLDSAVSTPIFTISGSNGGFSRVYDVHALKEVQSLALATDKGVRIYDISDPANPILDTNMSDQNFGAIFSIDTHAIPLDELFESFQVKAYFADYTNKRIYGYTFGDGPHSYVLDFNISTSTPPRHIFRDDINGTIFAALGSGGVMIVNGANPNNAIEVKTPGFAMQVVPMHDHNENNPTLQSSTLEFVVADYTGFALMQYDFDGTTISAPRLDAYIPKNGAMYGFSFAFDGVGISVDHTGSMTFYGENDWYNYYGDTLIIDATFIDYTPPSCSVSDPMCF